MKYDILSFEKTIYEEKKKKTLVPPRVAGEDMWMKGRLRSTVLWWGMQCGPAVVEERGGADVAGEGKNIPKKQRERKENNRI